MSTKSYVVATIPEGEQYAIYSDESVKPVAMVSPIYYSWAEDNDVKWVTDISGNKEYNSQLARLGIVNWNTEYYPLYDHFTISMTVVYKNIFKKIVFEVQAKGLEISMNTLPIVTFNKMAKELSEFLPLLSHEESFNIIRQSFPFDADWNKWSVKQQQGILNAENKLPEYSVEEDADKLPGIFTFVKSPCLCILGEKIELKQVIIHLNDEHSDWNRIRIADWLDKLHDEGIINIEFSPWEDEEK